MSTMYAETGTGVLSEDQLALQAKRDIAAGRSARKRMEPTWKQNMAFASGQFWLEIDRYTRNLVMPEELRDKELYTADVITEYRTHVLGELATDDDRPQLLLAQDDRRAEEYQAQLNRALAYGWDHEFDGDAALEEVDRLMIDLGTAAVRCRWDPGAGPMLPGDIPHVDGKPVLDPSAQKELMGNGPRPDVKMQQMRQGRILWEPLSAWNLIVPPGVPHERYFPWECVVRPVLLSEIKARYGSLAEDLTEDGDIASIIGETLGSTGGAGPYDKGSGGDTGRLRDHVWLFTYFKRPTAQFPRGMKLILGGNQMKPLELVDELPYQAPNGDWRSGLAYFHWWRVTGRFWSRSLVEAIKDPQRSINKRRTQNNEIIDRGMPAWFVEKGSQAKNRTGMPVEFIELGQQERQPIPHPGIAPGAWLQGDVEACREDIEHATGVRAARLGDNPQNITTYSQLALVNENDQTKREVIVAGRRRSIAQLVEDSVYDIRTYWGASRQIMVAGEEDQVRAEVFDATKIPPFYIVRTAKGTAKPRNQAARLQMVQDLWNGAIASGAAVTNSDAWLAWYYASLEAGDVLEVPTGQKDSQTGKAELENQMIAEGATPQVAYYDPPGVHIPIHRAEQDQAMLVGDVARWQRGEDHVQEHLAVAQQNLASMPQPPTLPAPPAAVGPGAPPPPAAPGPTLPPTPPNT